MQALESLLPPRPKFEMPAGEHVEEVNLHDFNPHEDRGSGNRGEAYHEDEGEMGGPGMRCAQQ